MAKENIEDRIIILRSAVLGDFILSSPAINFIREKHPKAQIYLLTIQSAHKKDRNAVRVYETEKKQPWLDFIDKNVVDEVIPIQSLDFKYLCCELRAKIKLIKPTKCYIVTDPLVKIKGNILKYLFMKCIGTHCPIYGWKDFVWTKKEKLSASEEFRCINHTLACFESVLEDPSITDDYIRVKFPIVIPKEGIEAAENIWKKYNLWNKHVIVISPGGLKPHKIWPTQNYIQLIKYLIVDVNNEIIITGTKSDLKIAEEISNNIGSERVHNLVGNTNLPCLAGILSKADLLIGNDGGSMHLGDALGCRAVTIMPGIEMDKAVGPWHNTLNSVRCDAGCSPCYDFDNCPKRSYICMKNISLESVITTIKNSSERKYSFNKVIVQVYRTGKKINLKVVDDRNKICEER